MDLRPLTSDELDGALASLPGWRLEGGALKKTFVWPSHRDAIAFLVRISFEAEARAHHPEIANVYGTVDLALRTHDAGGVVTAADVDLATAIEGVARR